MGAHLSTADAHPFTPSHVRKSRADRLTASTRPVVPGDRLPFPLDAFVANDDGLLVHVAKFDPKGEPKGIVVVCHGVAEHGGRYRHVAEALASRGLAVFVPDHQGHGRSEGERLFVRNFHDFAKDVLHVVRLAKREFPACADKVVVLGHSMGGAIAVDVLTSSPPGEFRAAVFSGALTEIDYTQISKGELSLLKVMGKRFPRYPAGRVKIETLCRNELVVDQYHNDPLVVSKPLTARILKEMMVFAEGVEKLAPTLTLPVLLIHGTKDGIVPVTSSEKFFVQLGSKDKTFDKIEGGMHEVLNEGEEVVQKVVEWIVAHVQ